MPELQRQEGKIYLKPPRDGKPAPYLGNDKAPPTRLLAQANPQLLDRLDIPNPGLSIAMNMILKVYSIGKLDFEGYRTTEDEKEVTK